MQEYSFQATGTVWHISIDADYVPEEFFVQLREHAFAFERTYSRFIKTSVIGLINREQSERQSERRYAISEEMVMLLSFGRELQELTEGYFDINVASILEGYGYDQSYSFEPNDARRMEVRGLWKVEGLELVCSGLVHLDFGAYGKGYLIGLLAEEIKKQGYQFCLVDGGRDFWGSSKRDGSPWKIALEHPKDATLAIGELELKNKALACSGVMHRKTDNFHHLINPHEHRPTEEVLASFVHCENPMIADGLSTAFFVSPISLHRNILRKYSPEYCVIYQDGRLEKSEGFPLYA